jgi:hypothetical protein
MRRTFRSGNEPLAAVITSDAVVRKIEASHGPIAVEISSDNKSSLRAQILPTNVKLSEGLVLEWDLAEDLHVVHAHSDSHDFPHLFLGNVVFPDMQTRQRPHIGDGIGKGGNT